MRTFLLEEQKHRRSLDTILGSVNRAAQIPSSPHNNARRGMSLTLNPSNAYIDIVGVEPTTHKSLKETRL